VKLRTRGRWGVQAGILAGMAVAAFVLVADLARVSPLYTPLFLSQALIDRGGLALGSDGVIQSLAGLSLGGRLAAFTALHLAVFTTLGVFAAGMSNVFHVRWSARTGAVAGLVMGFLVWLAASRAGTVWLAGAQLTPEIVVGAGIVGGAVLGWHLRLCHVDAEEAPRRIRKGTP